MKVLSLFDGLSCGRIALEKAGVPVEKYYAAEIDKYAEIVSNKNYPDIIRLGDVTKWREWGFDFSKIDLLLAGFPCQAWSMAGKQKGDTDPRGALVHDLIDIWNEIKKHNPDVKFLFENVRMKKEFLDYVNNLFGVEPICINSALVSAQNRVRYYWTNIEGIEQPKDKEIFLKDILEDNNEKIGRIVGRKINPETGKRDDYSKTIKTVQRVEPRLDNKSGCLTTVQKDNIVIRNKSKCVRSGGRDSYDRHEWDSVDNLHTRKLTVLECERLQTLPDNYTEGVSNSQRYKMIGNGWNVETIVHFFQGVE